MSDIEVMYTVYVISPLSKIYIGYTSNFSKRFLSHNNLGSEGFTIRYRPWIILFIEPYDSKSTAIKREKELKAGQGRKYIKEYLVNLKLISA